ncbi:site-specific DNA-methyltransferase, partial [bacterium]
MYKTLEISNDNILSDADKKAIILFNKFFKKNEVFLEFKNGKLYLNTREVDLNKLRDSIDYINSITNSKILLYVISQIESIRSYGLKNGKRNFVDYNKERKVKHRAKKEEKRGRYYYAKNNNFSKKNNKIPTEYENKIICDDSLKILKQLPDNCIDLIFTSPPYNFGLDYENNEDDHYWEDYFNKLFKIFDEAIRVLKWDGRIIVNVQPLFSDYIPSYYIINNYFMNKKLIWKRAILWEKNNYNCKYTAWGSWKSPSSPYLKYTWEFLEIYSKGSLKKDGEKE